MSSVQLVGIVKRFDEVLAVKGVSLDIKDGEFFSLLGPSGCGKTTILRMIAGFYTPTEGKILFDGRDVSILPPNRRNTGMVFQNYALFPHINVFENVAFGLRARKVSKTERHDRVMNALGLVNLAGYEYRHIAQLSGGQQQRVALARAIVIEPEILLLDEPLSNLDAKLRRDTRDQIRKLQQKLGTTTIYVTHDQEEALTLSDRIALLNNGLCQQVGYPHEIHNRPANAFVASFIGRSNLIGGVVEKVIGDKILVKMENGLDIEIEDANIPLGAGEIVRLAVRPETIALGNGDISRNIYEGIVISRQFNGYVVEYEVDIQGMKLFAIALNEGDSVFGVNDRVQVRIPAERVNIVND